MCNVSVLLYEYICPFCAEFHDDVDNVQCCELVMLRDIVLFKKNYVCGGVGRPGRKMGNSQ